MSGWAYCQKCGAKLVERTVMVEGFSRYDGQRIYQRQMICPNFRKGKGHDYYFKSEGDFPDPSPKRMR